MKNKIRVLLGEMIMTKEDILKMESGPDLDILISEIIMKYKKVNVPDSLWFATGQYRLLDYCIVFKNNSDEIQIADKSGWCRFRPSRDIGDAWKVIEKMIKDYPSDPYNGIVLGYGKTDFWYVEFPFPSWEYAEAENAPLAICRAALLSAMKQGNI